MLFVYIADTFIEHIQSLDIDEIQQMDNDLKANNWGVKSVLEVENAFDFLCLFQMFYHQNGRLPLTNELLIVLDGETPEGFEKVSQKLLYDMFKDTKSYGLVSLKFLCALNIFFGGNVFSVEKCPY